MVLCVLASCCVDSRGQVESPTSLNFPSKREASIGLSSCGTLASFFFGTGDHATGTPVRSFLADTGTHVFFLLCAPWLPHLQSGTHSHRSCLHRGCEGLRELIAELEKLYERDQ